MKRRILFERTLERTLLALMAGAGANIAIAGAAKANRSDPLDESGMEYNCTTCMATPTPTLMPVTAIQQPVLQYSPDNSYLTGAERYSLSSRTGERVLSAYMLTEKEIELLAKLVHHEAGGEPFEGKKAVVAVVLNRAYKPIIPEGGTEPYYPATIEEVVMQPWQFSYFNPKKKIDNPKDLDNCREAVLNVGTYGTSGIYMTNKRTGKKMQLTDRIISYRATSQFGMDWPGNICNGWARVYKGTIGGHHFYEAV